MMRSAAQAAARCITTALPWLRVPAARAFSGSNALVNGWVKKGDMASAQQAVERMGAAGVQPDAVAWTTLVDGWV